MFEWRVRSSIWYALVATLLGFYFGFMFMVPPLDTLHIPCFIGITLALCILTIATAGKGRIYA